MAKEYIEREAFREYAMEMTESTEIQFDMCYPYWQFSKAIKEMPAADVAPVRHGRWEKAVESQLDTHTGEYWEEYYYNCLECDYASEWKSPYCPNCGCRMDLEG